MLVMNHPWVYTSEVLAFLLHSASGACFNCGCQKLGLGTFLINIYLYQFAVFDMHPYSTMAMTPYAYRFFHLDFLCRNSYTSTKSGNTN